MTFDALMDSCYECDSVEITTHFGDIEDGKQKIKCVCRGCGTEWEDYEDLGD